MAERTVEELTEYLKTVDPRVEVLMYVRFIAKVLVEECNQCRVDGRAMGVVWREGRKGGKSFATPCVRCGDLRVMLEAGGM